MWLSLAFLSAFLLGCYEVCKKKSLDNNAVIPVLFLNTCFLQSVVPPVYCPFLRVSRTYAKFTLLCAPFHRSRAYLYHRQSGARPHIMDLRLFRHQTFAHHHSRANQGFPTHSHTHRSITHLRRATESLSMDRSHSGDRLVHYAILLRKKRRHQFQTQYLDSLYSPRHNHRCGQRVVRQISHVARLRPNDRTSMVLLLSNGDDDRYSLCIMVSQT